MPFLLFLIYIGSIMHPVHISSTSIEFDKEEKKFNISIKIFYDDFEAILNHKYKKDIKLGEDIKCVDCENIMIDYIKNNFALVVNEKDQTRSKLKFIEKRYNHEAIWLDFEFKFIGKLKKLRIKNSILHDLYADQTNLLIFSYQNIQKGYKFRYKENIVDIDLND